MPKVIAKESSGRQQAQADLLSQARSDTKCEKAPESDVCVHLASQPDIPLNFQNKLLLVGACSHGVAPISLIGLSLVSPDLRALVNLTPIRRAHTIEVSSRMLASDMNNNV